MGDTHKIPVIVALLLLSAAAPALSLIGSSLAPQGINETQTGDSPPLLILVRPQWDYWATETIEVIVKAYDPDGLANVSAGLPGLYMVPLTPMEPGNTTVYQGGVHGDLAFTIYQTEVAGETVDFIILTVIAQDTLGAVSKVNFTQRRMDPTNPPLIIAAPRDGARYIRGEGFMFAGGMPISYRYCPHDLTQTTTSPEEGGPCNGSIRLNWTVTVSLDGQQLLVQKVGEAGEGWWVEPGDAPYIDTYGLRPGEHTVTLSIYFDPIGDSFTEQSTFYVIDPGDPIVSAVLDKDNNRIELGQYNITILAPRISRPTRVWVYADPQIPGATPPSPVMEPILIVANHTGRLGPLHIYFRPDAGALQEMGLNISSLAPLAWDIDLNVWYPRGYYRVYPENNTVRMVTVYPLLGGGLYVALAPKVPAAIPPLVEILSPPDGAELESGSITLRWSARAGSAGLEAVLILVDGSLVATLPPTADNYTLSLAPGTHEIVVKAEDSSGLTGSSKVKVTVLGGASESSSSTTGAQGGGGSGDRLLAASAAAAVAAAGLLFAALKLGLLGRAGR